MKKTIISLCIILVFVSCGKTTLDYTPDSSVCVGLNTLITIPVGPSQIVLSDYVVDASRLDSVTTGSAGLVAAFNADSTIVDLYCAPEMEPMSVLNFWVDGVPYALPLRKSDKIIYTFTYDPRDTNPRRVQIAGQMNNWVPSMTPDLTLRPDGLYAVDLLLSPGTYLYQLLIDGEQNHDATNPAKVDNGFGKFNSIMQVNGNESLHPRLVTHTTAVNSFEVVMHGDVERLWLFWDNMLLNQEFASISDSILTVKIPTNALSVSRSYIRLWAANQYGVSNEILVPLNNGRIISNANTLGRHDKYAQVMYFLLTDRFANGDKTNDHPLNRPDVKSKADYQGGDLAGIKKTIDSGYFQRLGVNTLWISPLNQNPLEPYGYNEVADTKFAGYHGYWPVSSSKVDFRFGTNDELKSLVDDAHRNNINIILDYVANHVHQDHPLYQAHPEYATSMYLPDGRLNVELWDEQRLTTWFDTFMPSLDYSNPAVVDMMVDSAMFWVKEFGIDGFRHDACKHVDLAYWRALTHAMKVNDPEGDFYQIGESYGSPELMASYVNSGMLNGQFDFNVFDEASSAFNGVSGGTLTRLSNVLNSSLKYYGVHNLMGYISGNHDKPRFMALASGDIAVGEDAKVAGWTREIGVTDSTAYDKLALLHTFNLTIPGVPVIYYGDEIGMTGGNDPDCRRMMRFNDWNSREKDLFYKVSAMANLRRNNMSLIYGDYLPLMVTDTTMAYARQYFDTQSVVFINNSDSEIRFSVAVPNTTLNNTVRYSAVFEHPFTITDNRINIVLPPYSSEILSK